jgi:hypothetical protein
VLTADASEYDERGLAQMKDVPAEELVSALIQQSKSAHSRSSKCVSSPITFTTPPHGGGWG